MDASSLAAAALAVAMEDSRSAAVREVMLDRERAAMVAEDRSSYMAQRHFTHTQMIPGLHNADPRGVLGAGQRRAQDARRHARLADAHARGQ